jgi:hypothetical protein
MLNCLAAAVPGGERVVSAEEVFELRFSHPKRPMRLCTQALDWTSAFGRLTLCQYRQREPMSAIRAQWPLRVSTVPSWVELSEATYRWWSGGRSRPRNDALQYEAA